MHLEKLQSEFGPEASFDRVVLPHLDCHGTVVAATIVPQSTEAETLSAAWQLVQGLALWTLEHAHALPSNERFQIIVGWSRRVRTRQGQIYKTGGTVSELQKLVQASSPEEFDEATGRISLISGWQKDVFG